MHRVLEKAVVADDFHWGCVGLSGNGSASVSLTVVAPGGAAAAVEEGAVAADFAPLWTARHARHAFVGYASSLPLLVWLAVLAIDLGATQGALSFEFAPGAASSASASACAQLAAYASISALLAIAALFLAFAAWHRAWLLNVVRYASESASVCSFLCCSSRCAQAAQTAIGLVVLVLGLAVLGAADACGASSSLALVCVCECVCVRG